MSVFLCNKGHCGSVRMVVGFTTTRTISVYHHYSCEFEPRSWWGVFDTKLCDKVCQWLALCRWFSPGTPVSSTNRPDRHDVTEILLDMALNTISPKQPPPFPQCERIIYLRQYYLCIVYCPKIYSQACPCGHLY